MKRIITAFILLFISHAAYAFDDAVTVVVLNFTPLHSVAASEAVQVTEIIRSELIKSEYIKSIESDQMEKIEKEIQLQNTGITEELIIDLGKRLQAEYLILGSYSAEDDTLIVTVRLISAKTGENLDAWNCFTSKEQVTKDLPDLSDSIVNSILTSSLGNTLPNVKRQIQRNDLSDARNKFSLYQRTHMPDDEMSATEKELVLKLAEDHYQKAGKLLSGKSVAEAYAHSGKSVKYNPENEDYQELYKKILEEYTALKKKEYKTVIRESEKMYDAGRLDAAQKHLNRYKATEGTRFIDESYYTLINNIKKAVLSSECDKADNAISSLPYFLPFRTFTYNEFISYNSTISGSRDLLLSVLDEEPENRRALSLLDDANDAARYISRGVESQKEDDAFSSYLRQYRWHLNAGLTSQKFNMPASPLSPGESYLGIKIEGGLRNHSDENMTFMMQSSLSYINGTEKRSINNASYKLNYYSTALTLEVLPGYRVESFYFFIGPVFQADFLVRSAVNEANKNDKISAGFSTAIGAGVDVRIEWLYSENILTFVSYEYIPSLGLGVPDVVFSQYCFGAGYLF